MTTLSERIKEQAINLNNALSTLLKIYDGREPPITVKENLTMTRVILKSCLKKIDDFFGVEEL